MQCLYIVFKLKIDPLSILPEKLSFFHVVCAITVLLFSYERKFVGMQKAI